MANITQILGTDSLSSSRIILNDNFSSLNTGLSSIEALLDTGNQNLTLTGKVISGELEINNGGSIKFAVTPTQIINNVESKYTADLLLQKGISYQAGSSPASPITTQPAINQYDESTYFVDAATITSMSLFAAQEGREVTFIPVSGNMDLEVNGANAPIAGYSGATGGVITVLEDRAITLRYYGSSWYVISNNS